MPTWDETFIAMCDVIAERSKDESTKVGAVVVRDRVILTMGYNGVVRGVNDSVAERQERPRKYHWFEHAERNAIYNAVRHGVSLLGSTIYVHLHPCSDCCRAIVQSGIKEVVLWDVVVPERWIESCGEGSLILREAGVIKRLASRTLERVV